MLRSHIEVIDTYTFSCRPRTVADHIRCVKAETKQNEGKKVYTNIMFDPRVIRGNTYALRKHQVAGQTDHWEGQKQEGSVRQKRAKKRSKRLFRPTTPKAVEGRKHEDVQTDLYLEELSDRLVQVTVECQTDAFLDRPATPLFIPAKCGKDVSTQIEEGELFDFDMEVQPVLEVLVGKTMEQAMLEVVQEEELAELRAQQRAFQELRNADLVEVQRLEEQERRLTEEKKCRMLQQKAAQNKKQETEEKIAATLYAQNLMADMLSSVFLSLSDDGYICDRVQLEAETGFLPWLTTESSNNVEKHYMAQIVLDMIIQDVAKGSNLDFYTIGPKLG